MKKVLIVLLLIITTPSFAIKDSTKYFEDSFEELKAMIEGVIAPNFEKAVYLSEAPYWNNSYSYQDFNKLIDIHANNIKLMIEDNDHSDSLDFSVRVKSNGRFDINNLLYTESEKKALYKDVLTNWAIFKYITDTTFFCTYSHYPFSYSTHDPFGLKNWKTSQVFNLVGTSQQSGNCYALTAFYKILSERLNSKALLCTAPQHIYIQHKDHKGNSYNVELATAGHPSDGQLQVLTHTPSEGIRNGIALRSYDDRQTIGLLLVNLAKSYERSFKTKSDDFLLKCAELVLKYDNKNLNALLLKQQVLDERLFDFISSENIKSLDLVRDNNLFKELQSNTKLLYTLGYRPMPIDMQKAILEGFSNPKEASVFYYQDKNPKPFTSMKPLKKEDEEYMTLSNGLFKEVWTQQKTEVYGHFIFETSTQTIKGLEYTNFQAQIIDPVAFAYNFGARMYDARLGRWLSTDKYKSKTPGWSPYRAFYDDPINVIDTDGNIERDAKTGRIIVRGNAKGEQFVGDGELNSTTAKGVLGYITANDGKTKLPVFSPNQIYGIDYVKSNKENRTVMDYKSADGNCSFGTNCYGTVLTNGNYMVVAGASQVAQFLLADGYVDISTDNNSAINYQVGDILLFGNQDHVMRVVDIDANGQPIFESKFAGDSNGALGTFDQVNKYHSERENATFNLNDADIFRPTEGDNYIDQSSGSVVKKTEKKRIENVQGSDEVQY